MGGKKVLLFVQLADVPELRMALHEQLMVCKSSLVGNFTPTDGAGNVASFECLRHE